ncbi:3445_t:CDS:2 [Entrophospora sp. SA101]|nr:3445_t:CDS:2 [Entrophospora sp. SA101]
MNSIIAILQTAIRRVNMTLKNVGKQPPESIIDDDDTGSVSSDDIKKVRTDLDEFEISPTKAGVFSNAPSPPHFSLIDSDNEFDEGDKTDEENNEENSMFSNDINEVSFGKQSKTEFNGN